VSDTWSAAGGPLCASERVFSEGMVRRVAMFVAIRGLIGKLETMFGYFFVATGQ
jgi:hypothetical protein